MSNYRGLLHMAGDGVMVTLAGFWTVILGSSLVPQPYVAISVLLINLL